MAKAFIMYYSRTGITEKVALKLAEQLGCDMEKIRDAKDRKGALGFIVSGKESVMKQTAEIKPLENDPSAYDIVIIGTPVWANNMSTPVRAALKKYKDGFKKVCFFCTTGGSGIDSTFRRMEELCGKKPECVLGLRTREVKKDEYQSKLKDFSGKISASV